MERLQKVMARAGVASRRHCEELIAAGMVKVNGQVVTRLGTRVDPEKDTIEVAGRVLPRQPQEKVYILLNKPRGYVTTVKDPQGRPKVMDLLRGIKLRVYPVGRLDYDSEGLLLLTNDGELAFALTHPRHQVPKTYLVLVKGLPGNDKLDRMAGGLVLEDGPTAPAKVRLVGKKNGNAFLEITIHEGKKRLVRRMCAHIGHPVLRLKRIRIGSLTLKGLKPGRYRFLTREEIRQLRQAAGLGI
ncbi:23S rRNA pseudouridine2605 synthase/16S rRNA pseudouridine516 synthase [Desulfofundulus luciae]|uniref:Pseudouridine synthase n=2 Tax=Desulfofundulus luciae TaxID=74702 RepID=A0ABU0B087_9FIRM|nr:23S rRNA pseudouridine2605 synthase/16S rRNA pseudouridine516 synthase [Desulfofundulus luciae]